MTACRGTANWLGVYCAYTLDLSGRDPSAANAAVRTRPQAILPL
jgi:hypothetical protein